MKKSVVLSLLILLLAGAVVAGGVWAYTQYLYVDGEFYPKNGATLDLQDKDLTLEEYQSLSAKLPQSEILWSVPLSTGKVPSYEKEVTVASLTDGDVTLLGSMALLETVNANGCTDYSQLLALKAQKPDLEVRYQVTVSGEAYPQDTEVLQVTGLTAEDVGNMAWLPKLSKVEVSGAEDYSLLQALQKDHPEWNVTYTVSLGDGEFAGDSASVEVSDATYAQIAAALPGLPELKQLTLINPVAKGEELVALRNSYPDITIRWQVELYGQTVVDDVRELDISGVPVGSVEEVETAAACLPELEKLIMSDCGIDNETMAAFRERQRENYKVVWTVYLSDKAKARTDDIYFMPIQQGEYYLLDQHTENLKYCEDMICIDVGHHAIHNIDFVSYMPNLKYLIIAHTEVQDVSPIVNCQELIYLEVDWSTIRDYTPITKLKKLEDLNLNQTWCDLTPITEMTWLKNLWIPGRGYRWGQMLTEALPNTRVQYQKGNAPGEGWRNLQNYYDMRDILGMEYMK